jgi:hypothetical protein
MTALSRKDKSRFVESLERIEDERARYFLMMFCDALADYATGRKSRAHRHGTANTSPAHIKAIGERLNA